MTSLTQEQLVEFQRLGAATVHEGQGRTGALDSAITPLDRDAVLTGPALTVDCRPGDNLAIQYAVTVANPVTCSSSMPRATPRAALGAIC